MFPEKEQLLKNFLSCINWENKYIYIMELGKLLPKFPESFRIKKNLITGCQSYTWITLTSSVIDSTNTSSNYNYQTIIKFYGDSDSAIVKGIIVIIFSLYQHLDIKSIINLNAESLLNELQLNQNLTVTRVQGVHLILKAIRTQANKLFLKSDSKNNL